MDKKYTHTLGLMVATIYAARHIGGAGDEERGINVSGAVEDALELLQEILWAEDEDAPAPTTAEVA